VEYIISKKYIERYYHVNNTQYHGYSNLVLSTNEGEIGTLVYKKKDVFFIINNESFTITYKKKFLFRSNIVITEDRTMEIIGICSMPINKQITQTFQINIEIDKKQYTFVNVNTNNKIFNPNSKYLEKYAFKLKGEKEFALFEFEVEFPKSIFSGDAADKPFKGKITTNINNIKVIMTGLYLIEYFFNEYIDD
jgi:hypothetical protein